MISRNSVLVFICIVISYVYSIESGGYYVVQMPIEPKTSRRLDVYWNVPTIQCKSKKIPFSNLYEDFGIIQNKNDSFRGEQISILYDPGVFPALLKNVTSGKFIFRNGGVPQEGDLSRHLDEFRKVLNESVPDENFNGIGIIDFESWRPIYRQNFGILSPYKDISYEIEQSRHRFWTKKMLNAEAIRRFEHSAVDYMDLTLKLAKEMRPLGRWGYYAYPYCFNMAGKHMDEKCANNVPEENDRISWLWSRSTALYPSVYMSQELTSDQLAKMMGGRVREARRLSSNIPVLPYFWFKYREGGFLSEKHVKVSLETLYKSNASGFIIWGSSNDVNTKSKCLELQKYVNTVLGPAIAKYTKKINRISEFNEEDVSDINNNSQEINLNNTNSEPDPEFHWVPPENYTLDIISYVKNEFGNKNVIPNITCNNHSSSTNENNIKENNLINLLVNFLFKPKDQQEIVMDINENSTDIISTLDPLKTNVYDDSSYEISTINNILDCDTDFTTESSTNTYDITTNNDYADTLFETTELPYTNIMQSTELNDNNNPSTVKQNSITESVTYQSTIVNHYSKNYKKGLPQHQNKQFTTNDNSLSTITTTQSLYFSTEDIFTAKTINNNNVNDYETTTLNLNLEMDKKTTDIINDTVMNKMINKNIKKGLRNKKTIENESNDNFYLPTTKSLPWESITDNYNFEGDIIRHSMMNRIKNLSKNNKKGKIHISNEVRNSTESILNKNKEIRIENNYLGKNMKKGLPQHNSEKIENLDLIEPLLESDTLNMEKVSKNIKKGIPRENKRNEGINIKNDISLNRRETSFAENPDFNKSFKKGLHLQDKQTLNSNLNEIYTSMEYSTTEQVIVYDII